MNENPERYFCLNYVGRSHPSNLEEAIQSPFLDFKHQYEALVKEEETPPKPTKRHSPTTPTTTYVVISSGVSAISISAAVKGECLDIITFNCRVEEPSGLSLCGISSFENLHKYMEYLFSGHKRAKFQCDKFLSKAQYKAIGRRQPKHAQLAQDKNARMAERKKQAFTATVNPKQEAEVTMASMLAASRTTAANAAAADPLEEIEPEIKVAEDAEDVDKEEDDDEEKESSDDDEE
eukprot:Filipodium_phascolosomae@DN1244_c0_g1_i2.p1